MKNCMLLIIALLMILPSCKESVTDEKTILSTFTPFYRFPVVLNGKVKSIKVRTSWAYEEEGKVIKGDIITRTERDSLGYMSDFNLFITEDGVPQRLEWIMKDGKINHNEYEIVENKIISGKWYVNGEQRIYFKNEYDDSGYFIKESAYRYGADTLTRTMTSTNLENGNHTEWSNYNYKNELTRTRKFIWKKKDYISEFQSYNREGVLGYSMKIEYDENDNLISNTFNYPGERVTKYEWKDVENDELGNMVSVVTYKDDILFSVVEHIIEYYTGQ